MNPLDLIGSAANGSRKSVRHRDGQPESILQAFGLTIHIDRHEGTVLEGMGADGMPYRVIQRVPYGYLPGVLADDGEDFDVYVGPYHDAENVYVVTQCKASTGYYDEPKGMLGFQNAESAEACYREHTAPAMFGRIGTLSLDAFREQLAACRGVFRPETDEDAAECAALDDLETESTDVPEPDAEP